MEAVRGHFRVWYEGCVIQVILLRNKWVGIGIAYELIPLRGGALCFEWSFTRTCPGNQDVVVK